MKPHPWIAALSTAIAVALVPAIPAAATPPEQPRVTVSFERLAQWDGHQILNATLRNGNSTALPSWRVDFTLPAGTTVTSGWNAQFTQTGSRVAVTGESWSQPVPAHTSTSFGFITDGTGQPSYCLVNTQPCDGVPVDQTDPTRPDPLTLDLTDGVKLNWPASTDDQVLRYYEVFESGQLLATTTATSFVYRTGSTLPPRVYVFKVLAVDNGGNRSAAAYATLGNPWTDATVPAPTQLAIGDGGYGQQKLTWQTPIPPPVQTPLFAGWEVSLDGVKVADTGSQRYVSVPPQPGRHVWSVRTIDALNHYSAPTELVQVVG